MSQYVKRNMREVFRDLVDRANDIYDNRVEKLLDSMTRIELYELPTAEPWALDRFLDKVKQRCKDGSKELHKKSAMVEGNPWDCCG